MNDLEKQLFEALEPFVTGFQARRKLAGKRSPSRGVWFDKMADKSPMQMTLTMGDFRRAEKALGELRNEARKAAQ